MIMSVKDNLLEIQSRIAESAVKSGRRPEDILLLAVTKTVPADRIMEAYDLGLKTYGENRVQEYTAKVDVLPKDVDWHIIGRLQRNKIKYIAGKVALVHSLCAENVAEEMQRICTLRDTSMDCLVEVNVTGEESKDGVSPDRLEDFLSRISQFDRIRIKGLMTIGRFSPDPEDARAAFAELREWFEKLSKYRNDRFEMKYLSMGMSGDFQVAIEEGSNIVRVGSAIFGDRIY